jgi:general secretion pathway protein H
MPTSATGISTESRHGSPLAEHGFSLLEVLVVLLIVGITLTMATLSIGPGLGRDRGLNEAERLHALVALASEQAILQGIEHGLELSHGGYRILAYLDGQWLPLDDDPVWRPRELPDTLRVHLQTDGRSVTLPATAQGTPQVLLFSSGETTPYVIELSGPDGECVLRGDGVSGVPPAACPRG